MTCEIITKVQEIERAYADLRERCAPDYPASSGQVCVVPLILELVGLAQAISDSSLVTVTVARPDMSACLSDSYLAGVLAWINGMTCESGGNYPTAYLWFFGVGVDGMEGWGADMTFDGQMFIPVKLENGAVVWALGPTSDPAANYGIPFAWYTSGAHVGIQNLTVPEDPAMRLEAWDPETSRWLLQVYLSDSRIKFFTSRSSPDDEANIAAWLEAGYVVTYMVVGTVTASADINRWDFDLPGDILE